VNQELSIPSRRLVLAAANGDQEAADQVIGMLTGYALSEAKWFVRKRPSTQPYLQDFESECLLTLVRVLRKLNKSYDPIEPAGLLGYLRTSFRRACHRLYLGHAHPVTLYPGCNTPPGDLQALPLSDKVLATECSLLADVDAWGFLGTLNHLHFEFVIRRVTGDSLKQICEDMGLGRYQVRTIRQQLKRIINTTT